MSFKSAEMSRYVSQTKKDLFADAEWLLEDCVATQEAMDAEVKRTTELHEAWRKEQKYNIGGPRLGLSGLYGHTFTEAIEAGLPFDDLKVIPKPPFRRPEAPEQKPPVPLCRELTRELARLANEVSKYERRVTHFRNCLMVAEPVAKEGEAPPEGFISLTNEIEGAIPSLRAICTAEEQYFKLRLANLQTYYGDFLVSQTEEIMQQIDEDAWKRVVQAHRQLRTLKLTISHGIRKHEEKLNELRTYDEESKRKEGILVS